MHSIISKLTGVKVKKLDRGFEVKKFSYIYSLKGIILWRAKQLNVRYFFYINTR